MLLFLPLWLEKVFSILAAIFIVTAQVIFVRDIFRRKIKPSVLSWIGWALLMGTSMVSQIYSMGWAWSLTGIVFSTIACLFIFVTSLSLNQYLIKKTDWKFLALGFICVIIYYLSKDPWLTTCFAIGADLAVGIPTLVHA